MDGTELINRCKAGDRQALNLLYSHYKPQLLNICKQYTKDDSVAEDLLHDAFVVILTSLDKLRRDDKLEAWMSTIVRNVGYHYKMHLGKAHAALQQMAEESGLSITDPMGAVYDAEQLQTLVSQLPQGYQQVFRLSVFEGLSHQEIASLLGIAPHSSSSQLSHAKRMLRQLIRRSWMLFLLLIAIPTVIWRLLHKPELDILPQLRNQMPEVEPGEPVTVTTVETPADEPVYAAISKRATPASVRYQAETVILPDTIPYHPVEEHADDTLTLDSQDTLQPAREEPLYIASTKIATSSTQKPVWNITLAYNGQLRQGDDYLAPTTIAQGSFFAASNTMIPSGHVFDNWIGYTDYLNNTPDVSDDVETRSLRNIAIQNTSVKGGEMEAHHAYQPPVTIQLLLSRQLSRRLSLETGLSYTWLNATITTGSDKAFILERQQLRYLGIPLRLGWQWYSKAHLSLYASGGAMLELPVHSISEIQHIDNGMSTFHKKESLSAPCQWSATLGLGLQYDLTPHLGVYMEPSLQYFLDDGDLKNYRTAHPLNIILPLGVRFHW